MSRLALSLRRPLLASLLNDPWLNYASPSRLLDDYYDGAMNDEELAHMASYLPVAWWHASMLPRTATHQGGSEHGTSLVEKDDTHFKVNLDIRQFRPEEVNVKLVENCVVVHAKHEEREDQHGFIKREFTRSYMLPDDVDANKVEAKVGDDGTLRIIAPRLQQLEKPKETIIPIQHETRAGTSVASANSNTSAAPASGQPK